MSPLAHVVLLLLAGWVPAALLYGRLRRAERRILILASHIGRSARVEAARRRGMYLVP
jgi:hypothetical protein